MEQNQQISIGRLKKSKLCTGRGGPVFVSKVACRGSGEEKHTHNTHNLPKSAVQPAQLFSGCNISNLFYH